MEFVLSVQTQTYPYFQFLKDFVDLSCFIVRVFKPLASEGLLEEGFPTIVRNPSRVSET